jgi:hypothetical protein
MDSVVFAIDRKQRLPLPAGLSGDEFSRGYQALFIR